MLSKNDLKKEAAQRVRKPPIGRTVAKNYDIQRVCESIQNEEGNKRCT